MSLAASVIVRNEMGRYLDPFIAHLQDFCDTIIVLDDGSTDGTYEYLEEQDKVQVEALVDESGFFAGHEGRRRQALLDMTLNFHHGWVLAIDADEFVSDGSAVRRYIEQQPAREVGTLDMEEVWKAPMASLAIRTDGGWRPHGIPILWKTTLSGRRGQRLRIRDSALACGREPEGIRRYMGKARPTGSSILHFGWAREAGRQARYDRYVTADGGKFHRNEHLDSIMWPDEKVRLAYREWPEALLPYRDHLCALSL